MPAIKNDSPRRVAPIANVIRPYSDPRRVMVESAKEKLGEKANGMTFFFGDKQKAENGDYAEQGYVKVILPGRKDQEKHNGDPLFMRPEKYLHEHLSEAASISVEAAKSAKIADAEQYKTRTADGTIIGPEPEDI